ncbi:splicing factor, proline- and glutamine-rich-like [Dorcoceras hygrometricum]|uniref:Splicing factor, proline-and glutamine-rich-like n=1 Tax=Dorcoceras hygrometricum TaxID=472368 RepID=A0A2Z7CI43_9LAMI|nr:splicing factor, proline- and glutamine-rich-like [Dorcoceras hygrometricum]
MLIYQYAMASYLFFNTVHVCFESVLATDNAGMVAMFESLVSTGWIGFLGCRAVIHKAALLEFFENGLVRDGLVVSTVNGVTVEISEQMFVETFELPVEVLTDSSDIPKDLVFDARSIVSLSGEPVIISGKKKEMTIEFRLLCDILAKTLYVKARLLFNILKDMVTPGSRQAKGYAIQISLLLENVPNLELGESSEFPSSKILTDKAVHRYVVLNDKVGVEGVTDESRVKKTPVKKAASKKRPAVTTAAEPVVKKKRTTKSKSGSSKEKLEILSVAHEAVPLQMIAPNPVGPAEQPSVPKRKTQKRKRKLILGSDDEFVEQPAAKVAGETVVEQEPVVEVPGETFIEGIAEPHSEPAVADVANAVEEMETEAIEQSADEAMTLEDIFMTIPVECPLPSANVEITKITLGKSISIPGVDKGDWYKAGLPKIPMADKGKGPLMERDPVKGNPAKEQFSLILVDIEVLVKLREQIIDDVDKFFNSFSLKKLANLKIDESYFDKEALILSWAQTDSTRVALNRTMYILTKTIICVDGVWVIEPCGDHWVTIPREVVNNEISRQRSYNDTLPSVSYFFKLMKKRWGDICIEVAQFSVSSKLFPVGSINFCRTLAVFEPVSDSVSRQSTVTGWGWSQLCTAFVQYSLFSGLHTHDIRSFVSTIALDKSMLRDVQLVQSLVFVNSAVEDNNVQLLLDQRPHSPSTTADYSMNFVEDDIQLEDDSAPHQFVSTSFATAISDSIDALRESFSSFVANQSKDSWKMTNALSEVMNKIDHVKRVFLDILAEQNETFRGLFKRSRQEAQNDNNALSLALKVVRTQNVILSTYLEATRKEVKDINAALSKDFDDKLADICNELLEFRIATQLDVLFDYINRGGDAKKGESGSSQPRPPPDDQSRPWWGKWYQRWKSEKRR